MVFRGDKREAGILIALFILALAVRVIFLFSYPLKIWDEAVYADLGYDLSKSPFNYSFSGKWHDLVPSKEIPYSWPNAGFRAPLLPYALSVLYSFKLDFLISFFIPFIGAISVVGIYILGKKMFGRRAAVYSAVFLCFLPLHVVYSGKILTDVFVTFFIILTFISFWKGYEEGNSSHKILFGFFLALALLARYTTLWILPVLLFYFLVRHKSVRFLKDKYLWLSALVFFITLIPWMIYGFCTYQNPFGAFVHGFKSSSYWGGVQPWYFFFAQGWGMFSFIGLVFVFSLFYIFYVRNTSVFLGIPKTLQNFFDKGEYKNKGVYLILIWVFFFLFMASLMPHKEDRFILPIAPALCLLSGFFISKIKKYSKLIFFILILLVLLSLYFHFNFVRNKSYSESNLCFLEGNKFLRSVEGDALVITVESPLIYYYSKKEAVFYPNPWTMSSFRDIAKAHLNKSVYVFFTDFDMLPTDSWTLGIKKDLEKNFERVFVCGDDKTVIYKYRTQRFF